MHPTGGLCNGPGNTPGQIELAIPIIGIVLQNAAINNQLSLGVFALAIA
jgi:hypothetical protein